MRKSCGCLRGKSRCVPDFQYFEKRCINWKLTRRLYDVELLKARNVCCHIPDIDQSDRSTANAIESFWIDEYLSYRSAVRVGFPSTKPHVYKEPSWDDRISRTMDGPGQPVVSISNKRRRSICQRETSPSSVDAS